MSKQYITATEVAKLVRTALKEAAPGVKFSVQTSNSNCLRIKWMDGPSYKLIESFCQHWAGAYFDPMIDYQGANYFELDGVPCSLGSKFVFCNRDYTDAAVEKAIAQIARKCGSEIIPTAAQWRNGDSWNMPIYGEGTLSHGTDWQHAIHTALTKQSDRLALKPSPTAKRLRCAGDDGYGQGTVGTATDPRTGKGYAAAYA